MRSELAEQADRVIARSQVALDQYWNVTVPWLKKREAARRQQMPTEPGAGREAS